MNRRRIIRILGVLLLFASAFAYVVSAKHHETANTFESEARNATMNHEINSEEGDERRIESLTEIAASHQDESKRWGIGMIVAFIAGVVCLVGPSYFNRRNEAGASLGLSAVGEADSATRLTGAARKGAFAALAGAIVGLFALDMPARATYEPDFPSFQSSIPVRHCSIEENAMLLAGIAAAVIAGWLILNRNPSWRRPAEYVLLALAALLTLNAFYACIHIPGYYEQKDTFHLAYGAFLNLAGAIALLIGAIFILRALIRPPNAPSST